MAWFFTVLLALCSAGILGYALFLTRRLFRAEVADGVDRRVVGGGAVPRRTGSTPTEVSTTTGETRA